MLFRRISAANVTVALRKESESWEKAESAGFNVKEVDDAVPEADLVMMLIPDEKQAVMYENHLKGNIKDGAVLAFAHGLNIHFEMIVPLYKNFQLFNLHRPGAYCLEIFFIISQFWRA